MQIDIISIVRPASREQVVLDLKPNLTIQSKEPNATILNASVISFEIQHL